MSKIWNKFHWAVYYHFILTVRRTFTFMFNISHVAICDAVFLRNVIILTISYAVIHWFEIICSFDFLEGQSLIGAQDGDNWPITGSESDILFNFFLVLQSFKFLSTWLSSLIMSSRNLTQTWRYNLQIRWRNLDYYF